MLEKAILDEQQKQSIHPVDKQESYVTIMLVSHWPPAPVEDTASAKASPRKMTTVSHMYSIHIFIYTPCPFTKYNSQDKL